MAVPKVLPYWAKNIATSYLDRLDDLVDAAPFLKGKQQNLIPGGSKVVPVPANVASKPVYFDPRQKNLFSNNAGRTTTYTTPLRGQGELFRGGGGTQVSTIPTTNGPLQIAARQSVPSEVFIDKFGKAIPPLRNISQQSSMLPPYAGYTPLKYVVDAAGNVIDDIGNAVRTVGKSIPSAGSIGKAALTAGKLAGKAAGVVLGPVGMVAGELLMPSDLELAAMRGELTPAQNAPMRWKGFSNLFGDDTPSVPNMTTARQVSRLPQVPADEFTVGSELYNAAKASQAVNQPVQRVVNQPVKTVSINQPVKTVSINQPVRRVVNQPVPRIVNQSVTSQAQPIDTTFLNLQDAMDNAGIYPDYQGMNAADALRMANQRVDAQVAAYNPAMQTQESVDYNAILQEQALQMQEMQQYQQMQQQPRSRFFEEQPENMFWDPVTERYVTSREFYN